MMGSQLCHSRVFSHSREESEEEMSVLPRHTKVVVTGNNRTKSVLVGLQGVVKKAVGLGGWHWLVLKNGVEVKLQRNALSVLEPPTGNEDDDDGYDFEYSSCGSDIAEKEKHQFPSAVEFRKFSKPRIHHRYILKMFKDRDNVKHILEKSQWDSFVEDSKSSPTLAVAVCTTDWATNFKAFYNYIERTIEDFKSVKFLIINCDIAKAVGLKCDVKKMPTFIYLRNNVELGRIEGVEKDEHMDKDFDLFWDIASYSVQGEEDPLDADSVNQDAGVSWKKFGLPIRLFVEDVNKTMRLFFDV